MRVPEEPKAPISSDTPTLYDGSPYVDFYDPRLLNKSNITAFGQAGSGKTYHGEKRK